MLCGTGTKAGNAFAFKKMVFGFARESNTFFSFSS